MADFPISQEPEFSQTMRMLETTDLADAHLFNGMFGTVIENNVYLKQALEKKAGVSVSRGIILEAAGWAGEAPPYSYTFLLEEVTEDNNIEIIPPAQMSVEQYEQLVSAGICGGTQTTGSITLSAYGDKPVIDLPVVVLVRGD